MSAFCSAFYSMYNLLEVVRTFCRQDKEMENIGENSSSLSIKKFLTQKYM